jgi:phage-related protein
MTIAVFNPYPPPGLGTVHNNEIKLKKAAFGDGYTQTTRDGFNHIRKIITLKWDAITATWANGIEAFFVAQGADTPFYYTLYGDIQRQWTCESWTRSRHPGHHMMEATLREDFNIT